MDRIDFITGPEDSYYNQRKYKVTLYIDKSKDSLLKLSDYYPINDDCRKYEAEFNIHNLHTSVAVSNILAPSKEELIKYFYGEDD